MRRAGPFTVVSFHAHPDDEALLTGGTLAAAAAQGHRVVIVVATSGEAGLAAGGPAADELRVRREDELARSAAAIGAARVVLLGHADSGYVGQRVDDGRVAFADLDPQAVAYELAEVLCDEEADVLTTYDAAGGYGHPDHVQVHQVGLLAARMAGTPVVLEATVDRQALVRATALLRAASTVLPMPHLPDLRSAFTPRAELTHRIDVRPHLEHKLAALRAHASQVDSDEGVRTLRLLLRLPGPLRRRVLGTEWFREVGRVPGLRPLDDIFASVGDRRSAGR